ncbi:MAG: aldo/keto reductase [Anaerolineales bacterium]|nr:aldo/keto reductase [Anaerolineales bacterium]
MRYKLLGKSGLRVSEVCLGTMTFGETWGWGASREESRRIFDGYISAGGNFIDTAVNYTDGAAETLLGEFLSGQREAFVLATKYSLTTPDAKNPNSGGNSRKNMVQSLERSLKRLQTEYVDLFYLHAWDYLTPVEEVMRGLDDLVRAGKVLYVGISDTPDWIIAEANTLAELRGWSRFVAVQAPYSLLNRSLDWAILPMAKHWEMAVLPWGILESGILTGKFLDKVKDPTRVNPAELKLSEKSLEIVQVVKAISQETGRSMAQVAINWVRQQQSRALFIPLLGTRSVAQFEDNLAALEWELTAEQLSHLDEVSKMQLGFPHNFLEGNPYLFGATFDQIDTH